MTRLTYSQDKHSKFWEGTVSDVLIKTKADTWIRHSGLDFAQALAGLEGHLRQPPGKNSGYWSSDSVLPVTLMAASKGTLRQTKVPIQT